MLGVANTRAEAQTTTKDHQGNLLTLVRKLWVLAVAAFFASYESWEDNKAYSGDQFTGVRT
jgi:hypothetical protein